MTPLTQGNAEGIYLNEQGVQVTEGLLLVNGGSYAIPQIRSVRVGVQKLNRLRSVWLCGLLGLLIPFLVPSIGFGRILYFIPLGLVIGYGISYVFKPKYYLLIDFGNNEKSVLETTEREFIHRVATAVNRAISRSDGKTASTVPIKLQEISYSGEALEERGYAQGLARELLAGGLAPLILPVFGFLALIILVNLFTPTGSTNAAIPYIVILVFLILFIIDLIRKKR